MSKRHRNRKQHAARAVVASMTRSSLPAPSASWGYRGGFSSAPTWDGQKARDTLRSYYKSGADLDSDALRARARMAYWDSTQARAMLQRLADNVIGTGLTLRSAPAREVIGSAMSDDEWRAVADEIDVRFALWANSHEPDATGRRNLAELQSFAFLNELKDGDLPIILRYSGDYTRMSKLSLQFLDADQIDMRVTTWGTPDRAGLAIEAQARGNELHDGLELTKAGELVAIYALDPSDPYGKPTRIPVWGERRRFVLLPAILDLPGQVRGVGPLAALVHELQKITDYSVSELEAAVSNALIAGMIEPSEANDTRTKLANVAGGVQVRGTTTPSGTVEVSQEARIDKPGMWVGNLKAGEKLASFDTKRPNVNFGAFVDTVMKSLSSSLSIPVEVLNMTFNQNYSASRASLILFWEVVERWRLHVVSQLLAPIFEAWLREEVAMGRFPVLTANGFDSDPVRTRAWLQADWVGDSMPSIDPLKEAQAVELRQKLGHTNAEREAIKYNRTDVYDNAKRQAAITAQLPASEPSQLNTTPPSDDPEQDKPAQEGAA